MRRSTYSAVLTIWVWAMLPWVGLSLVDGMGRSMSAQTTADVLDGESQAEVDRLIEQGLEQLNTGQLAVALESFQQALGLSQKLGDDWRTGLSLLGIGRVYDAQGQLAQALTQYQQALSIFTSESVRSAFAEESRLLKGITLNNIGAVYDSLGRYEEALQYYQQALAIRREVGDREGEGTTLNNIGAVYRSLGRYEEALQQYQQALAIRREVGDRPGEGTTLNNIGLVYDSLGRYEEALQQYQQALAIRREVGDRPGEGTTLNNIGLVYDSLGRYEEALQQYQLALAISREVGDRPGEGTTLNNIGLVYDSLGRYEEALQQYQQALAIFREVGNLPGEGTTLNNVGAVYQSLGRYEEALQQYQQALAIRREVGDRRGEGTTFNNIGGVYQSLGRYEEALQQYQLALAIRREVGDRPGEGVTLNNIGYVLESQKQTELAIVFLKQSVNQYEKIRSDIRGLSVEEQQSYTDTVSKTYRKLADLLLSQDRILEAQQVLDLLKLEELREYTRNARSFESESGVALNPAEQQILADHGTIVAFGQKLLQCEQTNCAELQTLRDRQRDLIAGYNQQVSQFINTVRENRGNDRFFVNPDTFSEDMREIVAQPGTVLIYPFVQDDKLWLIWTAAGDVVGSRAIDVSQQKLGETVVQFRSLLETPHSDLDQLQAVGKQLYDWLIQPIEAELATQLPNGQSIDQLIFAQDRVLRYLPMAALYDGEQYLIQRYKLSTILSAELTDMNDRLTPNVAANQLLALGVSNPVNGLAALPNVETELDAIVQENSSDPIGIYPGQTFLNQNFNLTALELNLRNSQIVHIATHGKFVSGLPDQSYLVLGDGESLTIEQINRLGTDLRDVKLVVLSACETALGGPTADGLEVAGISSYFLAGQRASTVIASLWMVNDGSTSYLMQQFYRQLSQGNAGNPITTTAALRDAQLSLLNPASADRSDSASESRSGGSIGVRLRSGASPTGYSHPYYWAPFILIGNGL